MDAAVKLLSQKYFLFFEFFFNPSTPLSIENFPLAAIEDDKNRLLPIHMPTSMFYYHPTFTWNGHLNEHSTKMTAHFHFWAVHFLAPSVWPKMRIQTD